MKFIPAIEGLRGIAILLVIVSHAGLGNIVPGGFGVTLFFFISGFLITGLLLDEQDRTGHIALGMFYARRFLRLAPELLLMIAATALLYVAIGSPPHVGETLAAAFYMMNYFALLGGAVSLPFGALWSLAVEEHYYLVYPFTLKAFGKNRRHLLEAMIALVTLVLVWRMVLVFRFHVTDDRTYIATDTRIDSIIYGAILAVAIQLKLYRILDGYFALCVSAALLLASFMIRNDSFRQTVRYSIQGIALLPLFYQSVFGGGWLQRILENRILLWIGRLSYSLYLWHFPVYMLAARWHWPSIAAVPIFTALSAGSYYLIERHTRPLRKRLRPS